MRRGFRNLNISYRNKRDDSKLPYISHTNDMIRSSDSSYESYDRHYRQWHGTIFYAGGVAGLLWGYIYDGEENFTRLTFGIYQK